MKGGLDHSPPPQVGFTFVGEQTAAEQRFGPLQCPAFVKFLGAYDKEVPDHFRMIDENGLLRAHPKRGDIAELRQPG